MSPEEGRKFTSVTRAEKTALVPIRFAVVKEPKS